MDCGAVETWPHYNYEREHHFESGSDVISPSKTMHIVYAGGMKGLTKSVCNGCYEFTYLAKL
jgi:hypothetical protein